MISIQHTYIDLFNTLSHSDEMIGSGIQCNYGYAYSRVPRGIVSRDIQYQWSTDHWGVFTRQLRPLSEVFYGQWICDVCSDPVFYGGSLPWEVYKSEVERF